MLVGAATQFFCDPPANGNPLVSADEGIVDVTRDTYDDECVYRDDTMVLLELTTRDMMEVGTPDSDVPKSAPHIAQEQAVFYVLSMVVPPCFCIKDYMPCGLPACSA